ncbi:hypothetical protein EVAR_42413_1 [Eumeta japonica]|uniref:Uncharacterized protein n=1 Tax=Eumeta variegata TaxID=151549 RepID=A0A4C1X6U7_EUMVA|nr:hypothetical protein EVAR_42413_1 [Eumeta japonica]
MTNRLRKIGGSVATGSEAHFTRDTGSLLYLGPSVSRCVCLLLAVAQTRVKGAHTRRQRHRAGRPNSATAASPRLLPIGHCDVPHRGREASVCYSLYALHEHHA